MGARTDADVSVVWVLEEALSRQRRHLAVGDDVETLVAPPSIPLARDLLGHLPGRVDWDVPWDSPTACPVEPTGSIRGRVADIQAVIGRYRRTPDGTWEPAPGTARTRPVPSTCTPDPARSVWAQSGSPVLIGFLVALADPRLGRRLG